MDRERALEDIDPVTDVKTSSDKNNEVKPIVTKLRIKSKRIGNGSGSTSKLNANSARNWDSWECKLKSQLPTGGNQYSVSEASDEKEATNSRMGYSEASVDGFRRTRSMMKDNLGERDIYRSDSRKTKDYESAETSEAPETRRMRSREHNCKDWRPSSGLTVGLRSKSQRVRDLNSVDKRKPHNVMRKLSWLMLLEHDESLRYIPQKGDNVVYLRQGHENYIKYYRSSKVNNIWGTLRGKARAVEFCKVAALAYDTLPGSGESCCEITLEFVDPSSVLFGKIFELTLPELNDLPDFLVERTLYDASIKRNWTTRDKCKVWWKDPQGESGTWWDGRIVSVKPKSLDFPESPWERYVVRYKNDSADEIEHSPWELHDTNVPLEYPCLEEQNRAELLSIFEKLEESGNKSRDRYGIQRLKQISQKRDFLNRFPVPLSFDVIYSRLVNNYYRNLEAVEDDFMLMTSNALLYLEDDMDFAKKMKRLSHLLTETISRL